MPDIGRVLMLPCQSSVGKIIPAWQKGGISPEGKKQGSLIPGGEKSWVLDQEAKVHRSFFLELSWAWTLRCGEAYGT